METRTCYHCGREYAVIKSDILRAYNHTSPWLDDVCKRCSCYLRRYHKWTVTDKGARICCECFIRRRPLGQTVNALVRMRKRDALP